MYKRERLYVRWPAKDVEVVRTAAQKLDMSMSELVRRATLSAAVEALQRGTVPPAEPSDS